MFFDTHAHITLSKHLSCKEFVNNAFHAGVLGILDPGLSVTDIAFREQALAGLAGVVMGVAIAPHCSEKYMGSLELLQKDLLLLEEHIIKNRQQVVNSATPKICSIVAISEIGLEYFHCKPPYTLQHEIFKNQLNIARRLNLPVFLHLRNNGKKGDANFRDAYYDALQILQDFKEVDVCVHCFTAGAREAEILLCRGAYLAFGGIVTYKSAQEVAEVATSMNVSQMVLETDAPYLSPNPLRGKQNESANLPLIASHIANIRCETSLGLIEELARQTTQNARRLLRL